MAIVIPTYHPKSVRNRCVIEVFGGVFVLSLCFFDLSVGLWAFVIGLSQISFFFSSSQNSLFSTCFSIFEQEENFEFLKQDQTSLQFYIQLKQRALLFINGYHFNKITKFSIATGEILNTVGSFLFRFLFNFVLFPIPCYVFSSFLFISLFSV